MIYPFPFQKTPEKIEEVIGQKITYLSVLVKDEVPYSTPMISWLKTQNGIWHRFFIDAWMLHWSNFQEGEHIEHIEDDFENGIIKFNNDVWIVRNIMKEFDLKNKLILDAELTYFEKGKFVCCQLCIKFEDETSLILNDYGDIINPELFILEDK